MKLSGSRRMYAGSIELDREALMNARLPSDGRYIRELPVVKHLTRLELSSPVTFFCGENGAGKSTLIEAIAVACGFNPEGGSRNMDFSTRQSVSPLASYLHISHGLKRPRDGYFLRAESFYNVATEIEKLDAEPAAAPKLIGSYGGVSLHEMSHGESFFALMKNRFFGKGLYILDEPEAALSPSRVMAMLVLIDELVKDESQFIISTHSPILLSCRDSTVFELRDDGIFETPYKETMTFRTMKNFLDAPERTLKYLLSDEGSDLNI